MTTSVNAATAASRAAIWLALWAGLTVTPSAVAGGVAARYVRVENPTGFMMEWQEIEVFSGGKNVVFKHPEMFSGTVVPGHDPKKGEGVGMTDGNKDTHLRGPDFRAAVDPETNSPGINPWFEIDLGKPLDIERIVIYGSRYGTQRMFLDKGHRLVSLLDNDRRVAWAEKWDYYDKAHFPDGVFGFDVKPVQNPAVGVQIPLEAGNWAPMGWVMGAAEVKAAPNGELRMRRFAARNSPAEVEKLAGRFFSLLADDVPELAESRRLYGAGQYAEAMEGWKRFWFARMRHANMHVAFHGGFFNYGTQADDLVNGLAVTIGDTSATAIRFTPGQILWIDLPDAGKDKQALGAALTDTEQKAQVGRVTRPLLEAYRRRPDPKYLACWSEMTDDWSMNFFPDAAATPYEAENLFTFNPCNTWGTMMEDLADAAGEHPELVEQIPATTLARTQLICLEKYSTAWWRQARETVFNHETGGIVAWADVAPYIDEFYPGRRAAREVRQEFERWMTLGTEPDGSMTEIGDDGHMVMPMQLGVLLSRWDRERPAWYTLGWRNRATEWYDNNFKYILRHMSPGGYEHRFGVGYRPERWTSEVKPYVEGRPKNLVPLDRGEVLYGIPEVRRVLGALGHVSAGLPASPDPLRKPIVEQQQKAHDEVLALLGNDKHGRPYVNSDWMPYTGAYYFRGGWDDDAPFLAMMACGSHGGSQPTQWPYGMYYHYDYNYPLIRAQPLQVDGLPPNQLFGRRTFEPGTKTIALANAEENPAPHRWLSTERFDFGEAVYHGAYQKLPSFKGDWDYTLEQLPAGKAVEGVRTTRQILQLRGSRLFIVTDVVEFTSAEDKARPHALSIPFKFSLSSLQKGASKPLGPEQLQIDAKAATVRSDNPDGPSVSLYQFAGVPIRYRKGGEAKLDFKSYSPRLTGAIGIAEQDVFAEFEAASGSTLVSLISSRPRGGEERVASVEPFNRGPGVAGFHARLRDGGEVWYQFAATGKDKLACGPAEATAQALLVVTGKTPADGISGIVLGAQSFAMRGAAQEAFPAHAVQAAVGYPDFEFSAGGSPPLAQTIEIHAPIDPVRFRPGVNTFTDSQSVEMASQTPNVEIRYTTDGTPPTRTSRLYAGPLTITESTEFAARAYRLGPNGKPLEADDFEINGTRFTPPTYGWFYKKPFLPAAAVAEKDLEPGLNYDYLAAPWWRLYASGHWLPAAGGGTAELEMDLSKVATRDAYGMRYTGYIRIPEDGVYTFHAPHELAYMDNAPSYDLRLYLDGEEWYLTQWWHGHGTWSVPLKEGLHAFQVDFADARTTPWHKSGMWRYYPRVWVIYQGKPTDILVSRPGLTPARIPKEWLYRNPVQRTYPDERVLVDSAAELNCAAAGITDAPLAGVEEICFKTNGDPQQVFDGLAFIAADGAKHPFAQVAHDFAATGAAAGVSLNLHGRFDHLSGGLSLGPKEQAAILFSNTPAYQKANAAAVRD